MGKFDQFQMVDRAQEREAEVQTRFQKEVGYLLQASKPVFAAIEEAGLKYALIRHTGILFSLYDLDFLSFLEEINAYDSVNDVDILINFDREKIAQFVELLKEIPGIKDVYVEYREDPNRLRNPYGFLSDAFITFARVVDVGKGEPAEYKYEIFANYGLEPKQGSDYSNREIFASIDNEGNSARRGNILETVDYHDNIVGSMQVPYIVGRGISMSYIYQNEYHRDEFMNNKRAFRDVLLGSGYKAQIRGALASISQELIHMLSMK